MNLDVIGGSIIAELFGKDNMISNNLIIKMEFEEFKYRRSACYLIKKIDRSVFCVNTKGNG